MTFVLIMFCASSILGTAQIPYVNQLIIAQSNGSSENVTVFSYNPKNQLITQIDEIGTYYVQDIAIENNFAYINAQDSVIKYDINSYSRMASKALNNLNRLLITENAIFVSRWNSASSDFVFVLNKNDLSTITTIQVSDQAAGMLELSGKLYVTIPGTFGVTEGKLAIIDLSTYSVIQEIELGTETEGLRDIFTDGQFIYLLSTLAWGSQTGTLTKFNPADNSFVHHTINQSINRGVALNNNIIYVAFGNSIGTINTETCQIENAEFIQGNLPEYNAFGDVEYDFVNNFVYLTKTDFYSYGTFAAFDNNANELFEMEIGVAPEALAVDYRIDLQPVIQNPIADINLSINSTPMQIDLSNVFTDPDNDDFEMEYQITSNSNSELVQLSIENNILEISITENAQGTSEVCISASSNGQSVTECFIITVENGSGNEDQLFLNLCISPNPFGDYLQIYCDYEDEFLTIHSLAGKLVFQQKLNSGKNIISTECLQSGEYIATITGNKRKVVEKIIKN